MCKTNPIVYLQFGGYHTGLTVDAVELVVLLFEPANLNA